MNENGQALVRQADTAARNVSALGGDSESFNTAVRVAQSLASSSIVPPAYQGEKGVANVMVALEYANRLECSVLAVIQNLDVIHNRPALRATFLIGTVNASGRFSPIRYRWQGEEGTDSWGCRAVAVDRESGEECLGPLVTIATAKAEGWYNKNGSKWKTIPELMLMYRSGSWWTRVYAPDLSLGLHTTDEVEDMGPPPQQRRHQLAAVLDQTDESIEEAEAGEAPGIAEPEETPPAEATPDSEAITALKEELTELCAEKAPHLLNEKETRRTWSFRQIGKATTVRATEFELRQLIDAVKKGDTAAVPEQAQAEETVQATPFDDDGADQGAMPA